MRALDKVIGYESIKLELYRIIDIFHNPEKYKALGVSVPKGFILEGEPGIGKTLMAKSFIEESGRQTYVIRKDRPDGVFVDYIRETFEKAVKNAPSIVLLDDLDKFANEDMYHRDAEEYVTVQACIDEAKNKDVFIIATTNAIQELPDSLIRSGRFDKRFHMNFPKNEEARKIISFYLKDKMVAEDIDVEEIARFSGECSCADLETVVNEAGVYAGYEGKDFIGQEDLKRACLRKIYNAEESVDESDTESMNRRAVHEAGHAAIAEYFLPGAVSFATIHSNRHGINGMVLRKVDDHFHENFKNAEIEVMISLGGKAATELVLNEIDMGTNRDLRQAFRRVERLLDVAAYDFHSWVDDDPTSHTSHHVIDHFDIVKGAEMTRYYTMTKQILGKNRAFLDELIRQLLEKKTLSYKDIAPIREKYVMN